MPPARSSGPAGHPQPTAPAESDALPLETVAQLARRVAHDLNNILTPVIGGCDLALLALPDGHPARDDLATASAAAAVEGRLLAGRLADLERAISAGGRTELHAALGALGASLEPGKGEAVDASTDPDPAATDR